MFEEVKHTEFFARYFREVLPGVDPAAHFGVALQGVLVDDLEAVSDRLRRSPDGSEAARLDALAEGVTHYHGIVEGILAFAGYEDLAASWPGPDALPGLAEGFRRIREDEGRHIAFGMGFLHDLCLRRPQARQVVRATFDRYLPGLLDAYAGEGGPARFAGRMRTCYDRRRREIGLSDERGAAQ